jgi:hypothetical protein
MACGLLLCICIFGTALLTQKHRPSPPRLASWIAVAISATAGGILLGVSAEQMLHESFGIGGWLLQGSLLAAAIAAPLLSAHASMMERALPAFHELLTPTEGQSQHFTTRILGFTLIVTTLIAAQTALGLVFDARWRDFSFAALTMAVVPFWTVGILKPARSGAQPLAEAVFAGLFGAAALYIIFNEGFNNWQSLWTSAAYLVLGITLWRPRTVAVTETESIATTAVLVEIGSAAQTAATK